MAWSSLFPKGMFHPWLEPVLPPKRAIIQYFLPRCCCVPALSLLLLLQTHRERSRAEGWNCRGGNPSVAIPAPFPTIPISGDPIPCSKRNPRISLSREVFPALRGSAISVLKRFNGISVVSIKSLAVFSLEFGKRAEFGRSSDRLFGKAGFQLCLTVPRGSRDGLRECGAAPRSCQNPSIPSQSLLFPRESRAQPPTPPC